MKKYLRQHVPRKNSKKGLTLVEILVGVTIIVIVFGATLGAMTQGYSGTLRNADEDKAAAIASSVCDTVATSIKKLGMTDGDELQSYFNDHSPDNNAVILAATTVVSNINYLDTYDSVFTATGDYQFAIKFDKGHADIICENKLVVVDDKGSVLKEKSYVDKLLKYVLTQNNYIVMLFSEESKSTAKIVVYDILGEEVSQTELKEKIRTIDSDGRNVVVLTDNSVVCCDMQLKILNTISNKQNVDRIICID